MLIAAQIVGINACYIYLRDEYHDCRALLETEIAKLQAELPCGLPLIELRRGAGAYICGEESAMIESIEGKRGEPRMRPPCIAQAGLFGLPTLAHNFETLYWVRDIVEKGPQWFSNFEAPRENVKAYSPKAMAPIYGVPANALREVARQFANAKSAMISWGMGMGISQHIHGADNARCLIALATVTGQIGKPGSGLHSLRGQNNVQGASDAGLIPMMFPKYQPVAHQAAHHWFENFWQLSLDDQPGYAVVEIMRKVLAPEGDPHKIRGMYIMGENLAMNAPDLNHARHALASLEHLVVQDTFMAETAWLADVVLPATAWPEKIGTVRNTDRMVQLGKQALTPPGDARPDLWIIQELAKRIGPHVDLPLATASLCGANLVALGLQAGDVITVKSRRSSVAIHVRRCYPPRRPARGGGWLRHRCGEQRLTPAFEHVRKKPFKNTV